MTPVSTRFGHPRDLLLEQRPAARKYCELKMGSTLGRFRVLQEIGRGGHGVVYRAVDTALGRDVALKAVARAPNDAVAPSVPTEAELLCRVHDQHVVGIFDLIPHGDANVLVLELVVGAALDTLVRTEKLTAREVCALGIQLAEGLDALHQAGIVHGDIKPANLRLSSSGVLKILDLGVARVVPDATSRKPASAATQVVVGTVPYMSPEQLRGSVSDIRSDIWSAGTVLYELATGRRAFGKLTTTSRLTRILNGIVPRPNAIRPEVPAPLERVILKALNPDPDYRFQSARELIEALYDALMDDAGRSSRRGRASNPMSLSAVGSSAAKSTQLSLCNA